MEVHRYERFCVRNKNPNDKSRPFKCPGHYASAETVNNTTEQQPQDEQNEQQRNRNESQQQPEQNAQQQQNVQQQQNLEQQQQQQNVPVQIYYNPLYMAALCIHCT